MQPPKDASIGQAEGEHGLPLGCWIESRLRERIAGNDRDSNPGKSTPHLGGRDNGGVGKHLSSGAAPHLDLPLSFTARAGFQYKEVVSHMEDFGWSLKHPGPTTAPEVHPVLGQWLPR